MDVGRMCGQAVRESRRVGGARGTAARKRKRLMWCLASTLAVLAMPKGCFAAAAGDGGGVSTTLKSAERLLAAAAADYGDARGGADDAGGGGGTSAREEEAVGGENDGESERIHTASAVVDYPDAPPAPLAPLQKKRSKDRGAVEEKKIAPIRVEPMNPSKPKDGVQVVLDAGLSETGKGWFRQEHIGDNTFVFVANDVHMLDGLRGQVKRGKSAHLEVETMGWMCDAVGFAGGVRGKRRQLTGLHLTFHFTWR